MEYTIQKLNLEEELKPRTIEEGIDAISNDREDKDKKKSKKDKKKDEDKTLWKKTFNKNRLKKPNKVAVIYLRENGIAEPMELAVDNKGFFNINGKVYHEDRDCTYLLGKDKHPFAIIPEWSVVPIGRKSWYDQPMQKIFCVLQDHVMKGIRHAERVRTGEKGEGLKLNAKQIILYIILGIIVIAVLMNYL